MNAYWNEQGLVVHTEFLDGIVYDTIFQYGMNEKMRKMNAKLQKFNNI